MSGEWVGYFSHRAPASEGGGAAMQFASMQIELSDDGDAILGSGADGLGSFELQRGRRAVDVTPHSVEFSKVYTAVQVMGRHCHCHHRHHSHVHLHSPPPPLLQAGYAPMGDAADGAAVEVFCEGTVEPRTSCIRGEWHMAFRFSGKAYREMDRGPQRSGGGECPAASTSTPPPPPLHSPPHPPPLQGWATRSRTSRRTKKAMSCSGATSRRRRSRCRRCSSASSSRSSGSGATS